MSLDNLKCPVCGKLLIPKEDIIKSASSFQDCLRRCEDCQVGFSNRKKNPTMIYKDFTRNVPELLRQDLEYTLSKSINSINRTNKKNKFAFSTSEDALTWCFFKYFVLNNRWNDLLKLLNIKSEESHFDIYLWGTNICSNTFDNDFYQQLIQVSNSFNEDVSKRTEPDVIIKLKSKLIFIEVKYRSSNNVIAERNKFNKYYTSDVDQDLLFASGHYELYRNWAFASRLSFGNKFELINLGLNKLFNDKNKNKLKQFEDSLKSSIGQFTKLSWENILSNMKEDEFDEWFLKYLNKRIYVRR